MEVSLKHLPEKYSVFYIILFIRITKYIKINRFKGTIMAMGLYRDFLL
jgi:hypothetical protein